MLAHAERLGFAFAEIAGAPYWDETACYVFTADEIDTLEAATAELDLRCMEAVAYAVAKDLNGPLGIPDGAWPIVKRSFEKGEPTLYGRMDLRWDGSGAVRGGRDPVGMAAMPHRGRRAGSRPVQLDP
jgi:glutathionylspermidine synthase